MIEILTKRLFNAPRECLFELFENPKHLAQFWGPNGFTNTFETFEFKPDGNWKYMMHGPDGKNYPNQVKFLEIQRPEFIIYQHFKPNYKMTMRFEDRCGSTELIWFMEFESNPENEKLKNFLTEANQQNFDRLEAYLNTQR